MKQPKKPGLKESVAQLEEENTRLKARIAELEAHVPNWKRHAMRQPMRRLPRG